MMMQDALPGIKRFLAKVALSHHVQGFLIRLVAAFIVHVGRMSATQAAGAIRTQARHRASVIRFLAKLGWSDDWSVLAQLAEMVLQASSVVVAPGYSSWIRPTAASRASVPKTRSAGPTIGRGRRKANGGRRSTPSVRVMVLLWVCC